MKRIYGLLVVIAIFTSCNEVKLCNDPTAVASYVSSLALKDASDAIAQVSGEEGSHISLSRPSVIADSQGSVTLDIVYKDSAISGTTVYEDNELKVSSILHSVVLNQTYYPVEIDAEITVVDKKKGGTDVYVYTPGKVKIGKTSFDFLPDFTVCLAPYSRWR